MYLIDVIDVIENRTEIIVGTVQVFEVRYNVNRQHKTVRQNEQFRRLDRHYRNPLQSSHHYETKLFLKKDSDYLDFSGSEVCPKPY